MELSRANSQHWAMYPVVFHNIITIFCVVYVAIVLYLVIVISLYEKNSSQSDFLERNFNFRKEVLKNNNFISRQGVEIN